MAGASPSLHLPDRFQLLASLGEGSFGDVYRVYDKKMGREIALKRCRKVPGVDRGEFAREQRAISPLSAHPHIVTLYDVLEDAEDPLLLFELCAGEIAADRTWQQVLSVGVKIAGALATAHAAGVIHCDVKPANLLLSQQNEPQLADFGAARLTRHSVRWQRQLALTPEFAEPRVRRFELPADERSDLYSLALSLRALLARPAGPTPPGRAALLRVLDHAAAEDRAVRTGSAVELAAELQAVQLAFGLPPTPFRVPDTVDLGPDAGRVVAEDLALPLPRPSASLATVVRPEPSGPDPHRRTGSRPPVAALPGRRSRRRRALLTVVAVAVLAGGATASASLLLGGGAPGTEAPSRGDADASTASTGSTDPDGPLDGDRAALPPPSTEAGAAVAVAAAGSITFTSSRSGAPMPFRLDMASGRVTPIPLTTDDASEAVTSPDGSKVAAISTIDGRRTVVIADATGAVRTLEGEGDSASPTWSPDGAQLAFANNRSGSWDIWVYDETTGTSTAMVAGTSDERQPAWSPTGDRVALTSSREGADRLYVLDVGSGQLQPVGGEGAEPAWSPDGSTLAFVRRVDGASDLFTVASGSAGEGEIRRRTSDRATERSPAWTADGHHLVFARTEDEEQELYVLDLQSGDVERLTSSAGGDGFPRTG